MIRKILPVVIALLIAVLSYQQTVTVDSDTTASQPTPNTSDSRPPQLSDSDIARAFEQRLTAYQVQGSGSVLRVLSDDNEGSRHQRFVLRLSSGQTLMIAHNIDLAPRVPALQKGDRVSFYGEYEWNQQGGVIHWTHHDPQGSHVAGWLEHDGKRYQ